MRKLTPDEEHALAVLQKHESYCPPGDFPKLTSDDVRRIRARVAAGETQAAVACDMGTQQSTVGKIVRGERWGWLDDQI